MSEHDQIETVIGNEVGKITQPSKNAIDGLNSLTDKLSDNAIGDLIPGGLTGDGLLSKSLRCRLEELGGAILDLIEDGFGIADMLNGFEMPSLSELGEKLAQLNPMNLLEKLGDLSIEGITAKVGELIEGAVGMIGDIVNKTFEQVERVIKGVADMFDEFGDAIQNVGEFVDDVITGIIGGVGEVLQDLTKPIEDIVDALFAPCDKKTQTAGAAEQQKLLENKQLLDTDIQLNANNVMNINETAQTSGTVSRFAKESVNRLVETNVNSDQLPFEVDSKHAAAASDAQNKNAQESAKRKEIEVETTTLAKQQIGDQVVKQTVEAKKRGKVEDVKQSNVEQTNDEGELVGELFNTDDCDVLLRKFGTRVSSVEHLFMDSIKKLTTLDGSGVNGSSSLKWIDQIKRFVVVHYKDGRIQIGNMKEPQAIIEKWKRAKQDEKMNAWNDITGDVMILPLKNIDMLTEIFELSETAPTQQVLECEEKQADQFLATNGNMGFEYKWSPYARSFEALNEYKKSNEQDDLVNPGVTDSIVEKISVGGSTFNYTSGDIKKYNESADIINTINEQ